LEFREAIWHLTWQPGTRTLDFYLWVYSLVQKRTAHTGTRVALAPLSTVCNFRKINCARCSESFFWGLDSNWAFSMDAEVTFFRSM